MKQLSENINIRNKRVVEIFSKYYDVLVSYGRSIQDDIPMVEDCIQDLFLKFCQNENLLLNSENPYAYLKVSLRRQIISKLEKKRGQEKVNSKLREISVPSYEDALIKSQQSLQDSLNIKKAFGLLSPSQKTILTMRFYKSMSYDEIADKLDVQKRTVYNQIHDAMGKMRNSGLKK